jgi:uncharacterized C2H2 Zn-finger protein
MKVKEEPAVDFECHLPRFQTDRTLGGKLINVRRHENTGKLNEIESEIVQKRFKSKQSRSEHQLSHQKPCRVCNREISPSNMGKHLETHEKERKYQCKICSLKFLTAKSLQYHKRKDNADFQCQFCMRTFNLKSDFNKHMKRHARFLKCDHCGFLFKNKQQLMAHMRKKHMAAESSSVESAARHSRQKQVSEFIK